MSIVEKALRFGWQDAVNSIDRDGDCNSTPEEALAEFQSQHLWDNSSARAVLMLRVAANYISKHCPDMTWVYDEVICNGYCVANDCLAAADALEVDNA